MAAVGRWRVGAATRARAEASPTAIFWAAVGMAMLLGAIPRLVPALMSNFPLNDGAMFLLMAQELREYGYVLPAYTVYNNAAIPFAYPPLGFYLAASLNALTGVSLLDIVRILPPTIAVLTVPAYGLLAGTIARSRMQVVAAISPSLCCRAPSSG
jgi:hypothetical protein